MDMDNPSSKSSSGVDTINQLEMMNLGNKFYKEQKCIDAVAVYTQSITIHRCKIEWALLYTNRSAAYLGLENDILFFKRKMEMAKDDIKNAIELCPTWFQAHYRMGCFYEKLNNNEKAAKHFEIASILDPNNIELNNKLIHVMALIKPDNDFDVKYTKDEFLKIEAANRILGGSHWTAWKGYCYLKGIQVEKNYKMAAKLFADCEKDNDEFAMINLAHMYSMGLGVKKDTKMHIQLLRKAASRPLIQTNGEINKAVIKAEFLLGCAYQKSIGVFGEEEEAIVWYKRASDHGCANSPYNLGSLYLKGSSVEKNEEMAVYYWQLAADRNFVAACEALSQYYFSYDFDPDGALQWHRRFMTQSKIDVADSFFECNVANLRQQVDSRFICAWEVNKGVYTEGLSLRDRRRRFGKANSPNFDKLERQCIERAKRYFGNMTSSMDEFDIDHYPFPFKLSVLKDYTSDTARRIKQAVIHFSKAIKHLKTSRKLEFLVKINIVNELSECLRLEPLVVQWDEPDREIIAGIVDEIWIDMMAHQNRLVKTTCEIQILICYVYFHLSSLLEMKILLKASIGKYPEEFYFYSMFLSILLSLEDYEEGVEQAELALKRFPYNCELLLHRAKHVQGLGKNMCQVIESFEDFLSVAEPDHPEVPAVYYEIALVYSNLKMLHQHSVILDEVRDYYQMGMEAEKMQLPCFLPYKRDKHFEMLIQILSASADFGLVQVESKLTDPLRVEVVKNFREKLTANRKLKMTNCSKSNKKFQLKRFTPPNIAEIKLITFIEMDRSEMTYENFYLSITVVEDYFITDSIQLLLEDNNSDVMQAAVYNITMDWTVGGKFAYGSKIVIMNPYMSTNTDGKRMLIVEEPNSLIFMSGVSLKFCRFCRKPNADRRCSKCKKAFYCSQECFNSDWKVMNHKLICICQ
uniref:MYND-type domain-containing protein n=1 Tax=Strigamia maritima TaxID=126957 RepID=T1J235_STRMM